MQIKLHILPTIPKQDTDLRPYLTDTQGLNTHLIKSITVNQKNYRMLYIWLCIFLRMPIVNDSLHVSICDFELKAS